jgi:thymidylate kinase
MIYFFGSDGTGKTTHADLIALYLRRKGYRTWRASVKQHHTFAYLLLKLLSGGKPGGRALSYYGFSDELKRKIRTPWKILELVSLFPALLYRVLLPQLLGCIVVCDRYVLDTLVSLSYFLKDQRLISGICAKLLASMIPKNAVLFYMNADAETILKRKRDEPITLELIEYYKWAYQTLIKQLRLKTIIIDTSIAQVENVQKIILQRVAEESRQVTV